MFLAIPPSATDPKLGFFIVLIEFDSQNNRMPNKNQVYHLLTSSVRVESEKLVNLFAFD
mgnify:CR=1 FL=1